jgi:hypothetical protein
MAGGDIMNLNKSNWIFDLKIKSLKEQPNLVNMVLDAKWQLKISIGTNIFDPQLCNECRQKTKIVLRWHILVEESSEATEIFCFKCGMKLLTDIQQSPSKVARMEEVEILTPDYKERLQEIKENFDEINTEYRDK